MEPTARRPGAEIERLHEALLRAFPTHDDLAQMVRFGLGENLDAIAGEGKLETVVFHLLEWAEARGKLDALLAAARRANPGNPSLNAPADGMPAAAAPNNLRARNPLFRGRGEDLAALERVLREGGGKATLTHASVYGLGGVGKTAVALELAHRAVEAAAYPGGVWWVAAEGDPVDALVRFAPALRASAPEEVRRRLSETETRAEAIAEEVRLALQGQRAASLLVLDNVSRRWGSKVVPGGAVRVLVTTRDASLALGVARVLEVLSAEQAREVAGAIAGEPQGEAEAEARDRVVAAELGGLAVAVEMAARAVKGWFRGSWVAYERVLRGEMEKVLGDERLFGEYERGVFAALDLSIDRCDTEARVLLEGAAVLAPEDVPVGWVLAAAGVEADGLAAARGMAALKDLGLVTVDDEKGVVSMHRLVHRRVRARAEGEHAEVWGEVVGRGVGCVATWMEGAVRLIQTRAEMEAVEARREHVDQALGAAERIGKELAWIRIANTLAAHLQNRARYGESLVLSQLALAKAERLTPPDPSRVAICLSNLAVVHYDLGQPAAARPLLERALAIDEATHGPDHPTVAIRLSNLAMVHSDLGQPAAARPLLERALAIAEATYGPDHPTVAILLSNLAMVHKDLGQPAAARPLLERALAIGEATHGPDHPIVAIRLSSLATVHRALGQPAAARPLLERALAIDEATHGPDHPNVAIRLSNLALVHKDLGQPATARPLLERVLRIDEATYGPDHPEVATDLSNLATVHKALGQPAAARPLLERAVAIAEARLPPDHPHLATYRKLLAALGPR